MILSVGFTYDECISEEYCLRLRELKLKDMYLQDIVLIEELQSHIFRLASSDSACQL